METQAHNVFYYPGFDKIFWKYIEYKVKKKVFLKNKKNKRFSFGTININFIFAPAFKAM